jgi:aldose 1-epimerase
MAMTPPSGEQFEISHGEQRATVVEVGGGVRQYEVGGRPSSIPIRSRRSATALTGRR